VSHLLSSARHPAAERPDVAQTILMCLIVTQVRRARARRKPVSSGVRASPAEAATSQPPQDGGAGRQQAVVPDLVPARARRPEDLLQVGRLDDGHRHDHVTVVLAEDPGSGSHTILPGSRRWSSWAVWVFPPPNGPLSHTSMPRTLRRPLVLRGLV
jgi:hypothetical protein